MKPIRVSDDYGWETQTKGSEFLLFLEDALPKAMAFVEYKRRLLKRTIYWTIGAVLAIAGGAIAVIELPPDLWEQQLYFAGPFTGSVIAFLVCAIMVFTIFRRFRNVSFDGGITRIGGVPLNIASHRTSTGSIMLDEDGFLERVRLDYPNLQDTSEARAAYASYEDCVSNLPAVLSHESDREISTEEVEGLQSAALFREEANLSDAYERLTNAFRDINYTTVDLPLLYARNPVVKYLKNHDFRESSPKFQPAAESRRAIDSIMGIVGAVGDKSEDFEIDDWALTVRNRIGNDAVRLTIVRQNATTGVLGTIFPRLADTSNYSAYLFYCPYCHSDELDRLLRQDYNAFTDEEFLPVSWNDNARVRLVDWHNEVWQCCQCERQTSTPIPIHKLYKEIILPAYDSLLLEHESERTKIYSALREKKIEYKQQADRESEEVVRDNRREVDAQVFKLRGMNAQVTSTRRTVEQMEHLMAHLRTVSEENMKAIEDYSRQIQDEITSQNKEIEKQVHQEVEDNILQTEQTMNRLAYQAQIERKRQNAVQAQIAHGIESIQKNTQSIAASTAATAQNTGRIAQNTSKMVQQNDKLVRNSQVSASCDLANARRAGMEKHPWWRVGKNIRRSVRIAGDKFVGRSELDSAGRGI